MKKYLILFFSFFFACTGFSQTYTGTGGTISDDGNNNDFILNVSGLSPAAINTAHGLLKACLNMTHTYDGDMEVHLLAPDGTDILLFNGVGGSGNDFSNTCLDPASPTPIVSGNAPFTGSYSPMGFMGNANNGQNGNGQWILRCIDNGPQDIGNLLSWSITFGNNAPAPFGFTHSNIPIVIINTNNAAIPNEPKIAATMKIIYNGPSQLTYVNDPPNIYNGNIGIERRGAYSNSLPQKPYNFETRNASGLAMDTSLLGMPSEHDWLLIANYNDKAFVRNTLAYKLFTEMGHYASRSSFCEVILNGQYQGIYLLMEKIKRDKNRVDISKLDYNDNAGDSLTGGYIIKNDYWDNANSWQSNFHPVDHPSFDVHFVYEYRSPDSITTQQKNYIQSFFSSLETALYGSNFSDTVNGYRKYMSVTSFIDYFIVNELSRNNDGFKKSIFYHKDKNSASNPLAKLKAGPVWDFDWAWKNIQGCTIFSATNGSGWAHLINDCNPDVNSTGWYVRLLQDQRFADELKCRWVNLRSTILDTAYLFNYIDSTEFVLDSAQQRHYQQWGHLGQNSGAPEVGPIPTTFIGEVNTFKTWISKRITWMDANMPGMVSGCSFFGMEEEEAENLFSVFPNPTSGEFTVYGLQSAVSVSVFDVLGNNIKSSALSPQSPLMDLSGYPKGIYFVKATDEKGNFGVKKIILQ